MSAVTMNEIVDTVERIRRLDRILDAKEAEIAVAAEAMEAEVGYKKTIARCRLQEATTARDAAAAEYNELGASIPAPDELLYGFSVGRIADLRIKRSDIQQDIESLRQALGAEEAKAKAGAWRPKGTPPPPAVVKLQLQIAEKECDITRVDVEIQDLMKNVRAEEEMRAEKRAFAAWMADETGEVPAPESVRKREAAALQEFLATAVRIEIVTPAVVARRAAEKKAAAEEAARVAAEEAAWASEEARWRARRAREVTKRNEFFASLIAANKRRITAVATPELVIADA